jgi:hypothetical protein
MMAPVSSVAAAAIGHDGVFVNDRNASVGFIGDVSTSCVVIQSQSTSPVTEIGGMTVDAGTTDYHLYLSVDDPSVYGSLGFDQLTMAGVAGGSCSAKKAIAAFGTPANGTPTAERGLASMFDGDPYGLTVDANGIVYAHDSTSGTFGANGGVDALAPTLGATTNQAHLNAVISTAGPSGALQNMAVGPYGAGSGLYVVAADGIEVFAVPISGSQTPDATITSPYGTAVSIILNGDGRLWTLLANGKIEALPPQ